MRKKKTPGNQAAAALPARIEHWPVGKLIPYAKNPRTHSAEQVAQIAASIQEFGFTNPILVDTNAGIIAGHGRLLAAQHLELQEVPVIVLDHLTETQKRAYILADNKLALNAGWDDGLLAAELNALQQEGFDVALTGFTEEDLDAMLDGGQDRIAPVDLRPPPKLVWILMGIPIAQYGAAEKHVAELQRISAVSVQSTRD